MVPPPGNLLMKPLLAAALILAPSLAFAASDEITHVKYACDDNQVLDVVFVNTAAGESYAVISQMDELIPMQITPMASGASYKPVSPDYTYMLHTKGKTADLVTVKGDQDTPVLSNCTSE